MIRKDPSESVAELEKFGGGATIDHLATDHHYYRKLTGGGQNRLMEAVWCVATCHK
jgi:hypothetical protein